MIYKIEYLHDGVVSFYDIIEKEVAPRLHNDGEVVTNCDGRTYQERIVPVPEGQISGIGYRHYPDGESTLLWGWMYSYPES